MDQKLLAAIGAGLLLALRSAAASSIDLMELPMEALMQVRISGSTLRDETLSTVPAAVSVFTAEDIHHLGVRTLEQLINHAPGFQSFRSDDSFSNFSARSRRIASAPREVLVLLDGQRLNHDFTGTSISYNSLLSLDNVERVEFLRGPGSAIYGANAFLGVINIITRTAYNAATISAGNHPQQRAALSVSNQTDRKNAAQKTGNAPSVSLFANGLYDNGERQGLFDPDPSVRATVDSRNQQSHNEVYLRAQWSDWSLQARHTEINSRDGYVLGAIGNDHNTMFSSSDLLAVNYRHALNANWDVRASFHHSPYAFFPRWRTRATPLTVFDASLEGYDEGIDTSLNWHEGNASALMGAEYTHNVLASASGYSWQPPAITSSAVELNQTGSRSVHAVYAQWQDRIGDQLTYILGVRDDVYSDVDGHVSPRLGLIWQPTANDSIKLLYGEAFRAPARNEVGLKNNSLQAGNPDLRPEISRTLETLWVHNAGAHLGSIGLFDTVIEDGIVYTDPAPPAVKTFINGPDQHESGIEMEWQWLFADGWQLRSNLTHIFNSPMAANADAEDLLGGSLIYHRDRLTASLSARYHGASTDTYTTGPITSGENHLGGYTLFDAHLGFQLAPQWEWFVDIRNLSGKNYHSAAIQGTTNTQGVPGEARAFETGIRWLF